jgi:hypothetical protein
VAILIFTAWDDFVRAPTPAEMGQTAKRRATRALSAKRRDGIATQGFQGLDQGANAQGTTAENLPIGEVQ